MNVWFASDHHFGHHNIISYSKRPFTSPQDMEEALIHNHNQLVGRGDQVYILGDFSFEEPDRIVSRLNGQKFLILGNHDWRWKKTHHACGKWAWIRDVELITIDNQAIWLSHYPHRSWPGSAHDTWHLHGHEHGGNYSEAKPGARSLDVGVDVWKYQPISFEQVRDWMRRVTA